jgi:hypothetical protein
MNKTWKIVMAGLLAAGLAGCTKPAPAETPAVEETAQTTTEETKEALGAWEKAENAEMTPELIEMFEKAFGKDSGFKPSKLLATQIVSGTNYLVECIGEDGAKKVMAFNVNLEGLASALADDAIPAEFLEDVKADENAAEAPAKNENKAEEKPVEQTEAESEKTDEKN